MTNKELEQRVKELEQRVKELEYDNGEINRKHNLRKALIQSARMVIKEKGDHVKDIYKRTAEYQKIYTRHRAGGAIESNKKRKSIATLRRDIIKEYLNVNPKPNIKSTTIEWVIIESCNLSVSVRTIQNDLKIINSEKR